MNYIDTTTGEIIEDAARVKRIQRLAQANYTVYRHGKPTYKNNTKRYKPDVESDWLTGIGVAVVALTTLWVYFTIIMSV